MINDGKYSVWTRTKAKNTTWIHRFMGNVMSKQTDQRGGPRCCRLCSGPPHRWARQTPAWQRCSPSPPQLLSSSALSSTATPGGGQVWGKCVVTNLLFEQRPPSRKASDHRQASWWMLCLWGNHLRSICPYERHPVPVIIITKPLKGKEVNCCYSPDLQLGNHYFFIIN